MIKWTTPFALSSLGKRVLSVFYSLLILAFASLDYYTYQYEHNHRTQS